MKAKVVIEFTLSNLCEQKDLDDSGMTFEELIRWLIAEEGLFGICDEDWKVMRIEQVDEEV